MRSSLIAALASSSLVLCTAAQARAQSSGDFAYGSYGRMNIASDLRGGEGRQANIVSHGTRIDEDSYAELQLERRDHFAASYGDGVDTRIVTTIAFAGPFFHATGDFNANIAVRNLYAEATGMLVRGFTVWAGSRMYRGDDIYLLDWWPLDNLNTVGGGAKLAFDTTGKQNTSIAFHVGMARPNDPFQYQTTASAAPGGFGSVDVVTLDRPRIVASLRGQHLEYLDKPGGPGIKLVLYGEYHSMSNGVQTSDQNLQQSLPADHGTMVGAQIGFFTGQHDTFINLFVRYASGLAAYGDTTVPNALAADKTTQGAHEALIALSTNIESGPFGLLVAGYVRGFRDASGDPYSYDSFNEGTIVARPQVWVGEHFGLAGEASYQSLTRAAVDASGAQVRGSEWRFGLIPFLSPAGRGSFTRPHFRVIYALTLRDDGARALYAPDDIFAKRSVEHYFGVGAEWWFNSSYR
ncbi:MAG: carbohydrate porin [Polyangiales bacterium]